jgi:hypothetical protein
MSTRYDVLLTTIAVAGPDRSGSAGGEPVPSRTTFVGAAPGRAGGVCAEMLTQALAIRTVYIRMADSRFVRHGSIPDVRAQAIRVAPPAVFAREAGPRRNIK